MSKPKIASIINIAGLAEKTVLPGKSLGNYQQRISEAFKGSLYSLEQAEIDKIVNRLELDLRLAIKHFKTLSANRTKQEAA